MPKLSQSVAVATRVTPIFPSLPGCLQIWNTQ